ncbi:lipoate--protein ligase family protein [Candidatus Obscuribacterales bacterium]|nr:lipoate--protein ligase family protein [Candidatus Obscuribacterales bacterium]
MSKSWRLIPYSVHDAADNMAIDEAILDAHLSGQSPPTLRLYGWKPPAVSIGYGQKLSAPVEERIRSHGFDIVRRATGGRAVLHSHELTYSFIGSATSGGSDEDAFLSESVVKAYKQICEGLIQAFQELGLELSLGASSAEYRNAHDCFLATTSADLHYQGKKMIGSAQLRRKTAVLQHGSILLDQPQDLMRTLLRDSASKFADGGEVSDATKFSVDAERTDSSLSESEENMNQRHANLYEIVREKVTIERLQESMKAGFETAFQHPLVEGGLTDHEKSLAAQHRIKYQQPLGLKT